MINIRPEFHSLMTYRPVYTEHVLQSDPERRDTTKGLTNYIVQVS